MYVSKYLTASSSVCEFDTETIVIYLLAVLAEKLDLLTECLFLLDSLNLRWVIIKTKRITGHEGDRICSYAKASGLCIMGL